jgi:hypothetical protein
MGAPLMTNDDRRYTRHSYYANRDPAGTGMLGEHEATVEAVRIGGPDVPNRYERLPTVELLVAKGVPQSAIIEAIQALTGRPALNRLHELRSVDPERFPVDAYDALSVENRRKAHNFIRQLAEA